MDRGRVYGSARAGWVRRARAGCPRRRPANGGWRSRRPRTGPGARDAACGRPGTVAGGWWSRTCRSRIGRWCWYGPSGRGVAPSGSTQWEVADRGVRRDCPARAVLSERARTEICRRVGPGEHSRVAFHFGVSWHAAMVATARPPPVPRRPPDPPGFTECDRAGRDVLLGRHRRAPDPAGDRDHGPRHGPPGRCSACSQRHRRGRLARHQARPMADEGIRPCGDRPLPALRHRGRRWAARRPPGGRPLPC